MQRKLYEIIASCVDARITCGKTGNKEWFAKHKETVDALVRVYMPSGSGFDSGTRLDWDKSNGERLVFNTSFHHMDDGGVYAGWTDHAVTVKPSLALGMVLSISNRDHKGIKELIADAFHNALSLSLVPDMEAGNYKLVA